VAVNDVTELQQIIEDKMQINSCVPEIFEFVKQSLMQCAVPCVEALGQQFKHLF
jgi:hypothetical protein